MRWKIAAFYVVAHLSIIHSDFDYMGLLSETLRTRHGLGCTTPGAALDSITLRCPPGTTISVTMARYTDHPSTPDAPDAFAALDASDVADVPVCPVPEVASNDLFVRNCTGGSKGKWRDAAHGSWGRYSLLQTVVEACQKKRQCRVSANRSEKGPCFHRGHLRRPRLIELTYKCRPYEFRSTVACDGETIALSCNPGNRVAVYSAVYGRTEYETFHCPQPSGVPEETCVAEGGIRGVMRACHGRRSCFLSVTPESFIHPLSTNPCKEINTKPYLYVVYTCVPRRVLAEVYEVPQLPDEAETPTEVDILEEGFDKVDFKAAFSPSPNLVARPPATQEMSRTSRIPVLQPPAYDEGVAPRGDEEEDEGTFYVWIGICSGILVAIIAILGRLIFYQIHSQGANRSRQPNIKYQGEIGTLEADLDLTSVSSAHEKRRVVPFGAVFLRGVALIDTTMY
ncbi:uncharacterized protein LOC105703012 [Orussus abietinus]|uniref:uncharacterized protein LOC105703012 n=1 Tax=Orussus abietinus TaxID=222816 RepID=UPI000C715F28|nr:uncharacterized protein LOC105703012 [Orussus abietinus]